MATSPDMGFTTDGTLGLPVRPVKPSPVSTGEVLNESQLGLDAQAVRDAQNAPVESALAWDNSSFLDKADHVAQQWDTTHILQGIQADMRRVDDVEAGYAAEDYIGGVMQQYGLEANEGNIRELSRTTSQRDLHETAQTLQAHQQAQQALADHGAYAFLGGAVDPVWLAMEVGTLGASSALQLGRVGRAAVAASQALAITEGADRMGRDTSAGEFLLNAALAGGFAAVFGPEAAKTGQTPVGKVTPAGQVAGPTGVGAAELRGAGLNSATPVPDMKFDNPLGGVNRWTTEFDNLTPNPDTVLFSARVMDDPLGRTAQVQENSAASLHRVWKNRAEGMLKEYTDHVDDVMKRRGGFGFFTRTLDWQGNARAFRDSFENEVYSDILRRDRQYRQMGTVTRNADDDIARAVEHVENLNNFAGQTAKDAGLAGFEEFTPRPGYIHRAWNADAAVGAMKRYGADTVRELFQKGVKQSLRGAVTPEDAELIADAFVTRLRAMHQNERVDFRGSLGKVDTESIRDMLEQSGASQKRIDSIMQRLEQNLDEKSRIKYAKGRVDLDLSAYVDTPDGPLSLTDLVYKDVGRISENYAHQMTGRAALAAAGVGASDAEVRSFAQRWADAIVGPNGTSSQLKEAQLKIAGVLGDFTGMRPEQFQLSPGLQTTSNLTGMTVLAASGLWQIGEYGTLAFKFGLKNTVDAFTQYAPGLRRALEKIRTHPGLLQEFNDVANFQLTRDVQFKPWLRQIEMNELAKDSRWQRALHYGKQSIPYVNGMKYVQAHQAQMAGELAIQTLVKAARGDRGALARLKGHNISEDTLKRISDNVANFGQVQNGRVTKLGMGAWSATDAERMTMAASRLMDSGLLMARTGEGASWLRSSTGQVLGMFRSFVAYSHNKQLRAITANHGVLGMAHIMAYQYPLMYMMMYVNDKRKNPIGGGADAAELAQKTFGMLGAMGFLGDAASVLGLTGGQGGLSTPVFGAFNNLNGLIKGGKSMVSGDVDTGAWQAGKALIMSTPVIAAFPATQMLVESVKPDSASK